jgi:uncharacterized protein (DUF2141 family)
MKRWIYQTLSAGLLVGTGLMAGAAQAQLNLTSRLTVEVEGLNSTAGNLCYKIFNGSQGFPSGDDNAIVRRCTPIGDIDLADPISETFEDLPAGTYAVAIYHDANGDEVLNRGLFGMPSEGYGFSNNAVARTGPVSYDAAMFLLGGHTTIQIRLQYP